MAFTDCICEIAFSHSKSTQRLNMRDTRHDDGMKWVHNVLYRLRKERRVMEEIRRTSKGLARRIGVATTKTRPSVWIASRCQAGVSPSEEVLTLHDGEVENPVVHKIKKKPNSESANA